MNQKTTYTFVFSLIDIANLFFLAALFVFLIFTGSRSPYFTYMLFLYTLVFSIVRIIARWRKKLPGTKSVNRILFLYPLTLFIIMYESLAALLPYFNSMRYDSTIEAWDKMILGVSSTIWLQQYTTPWLTELMYIFYFIYFPLPLILVIFLMAKQKYRAAEKVLFTLLICYYGAYICYFFIPVVGPKYFLESQYSVPLDGILFSEPIHALINFGEPSRLDCFPSLHAAILIVTLALAFRFHRAMFYYFLPAGIGIMFSLIYLRYHYFVDVLAGALWAVISVVLAHWLYKKLHHRFSFHFR
ncbi:MAG TPA: phosphatase PAP2 family protein [Bacteroidia bacterium]|nr:phosphatase PAP2 family protein [Bacteroidia bacterium]